MLPLYQPMDDACMYMAHIQKDVNEIVTKLHMRKLHLDSTGTKTLTYSTKIMPTIVLQKVLAEMKSIVKAIHISNENNCTNYYISW